MTLDLFTKAFIEAALWSTTDDSDDAGGQPLDANYSVDDIDEKCLSALAEECERFQVEFAEEIEERDSSQAGHDFWLTRCGHGCGFWDGDWPINGEALTKGSKRFGNVDLYVGDAGLICAIGYESGKRNRSIP